MLFRRRYNCHFQNLPAWRDGNLVGVHAKSGIYLVPWIGCVDRVVARRLPEAHEVPLDFKAWAPCPVSGYHWFNDGLYIVGCLTDLGALAVLKYNEPLFKPMAKFKLFDTIPEGTPL